MNSSCLNCESWRVARQLTRFREFAENPPHHCPVRKMNPRYIYHLAKKENWEASNDEYTGGTLDKKDGFIHFSTAKHVRQSAHLYLFGELDLVLLKVDTQLLANPEELRWEVANVKRTVDPFPHLYGKLHKSAVTLAMDLHWNKEAQQHEFPDLE